MPAIPPAVRILPMSAREPSFRGLSVEDVQARFFLDVLPNPPRSGRYLFPTSGLSAPPGTVVLFQYTGRVVASAVFVRTEKFAEQRDGYRGALLFDPATVRTFEPVGPEAVGKVWPGFIGFGHVKQSLDPNRYPEFERGLVGVATPRRWPALPLDGSSLDGP